MQKNILIHGIIFLIGVFGVALFPTNDPFQMTLVGLAFFTLFPLLAIRFILKRSLREYGFSLRISKKSCIEMIYLLLATVALFIALYANTRLGVDYVPTFLSTESFALYFFFVIFLNGVLALLFSTFFFGLTLQGLKTFLGSWSVFATWILFIFALFVIDTLSWENAPFIFSSVFAAPLAYRTQSVFLTFLYLWLFAIIGDTIILRFL